jgi:hypothetical protein
MQKIYIVRLSEDERSVCLALVKKLKGSSQKVRRANILLKADAGGPNWKDQDIADAFLCSRQCVENLRKEEASPKASTVPCTENNVKRRRVKNC